MKFGATFTVLIALLTHHSAGLGGLREGAFCGPGFNTKCADGYGCEYHKISYRCMKYVYPGEACYLPFHYCKDGAKCVDDYCLKYVGKGEKCGLPGIKCEHGLDCVGTKGYETCQKYRKLGESCPAHEPYWKCHPGLVCKNEVCMKQIKAHQTCNNPYFLCPAGTYCLGPKIQKKCKPYMKLGEECEIDPYWLCEPGLFCKNKRCFKKVKERQYCTNPYYMCPHETHCVGPKGKEKCTRYMDIGKDCELDPYWFCKSGLLCKNNKCVKMVKKHDSCSKPYHMCPHETYCIGPKGKEKCKPYMDKGEKCGVDPYWVCKHGLKCVNYICK